jgi:hypothetical protein
MVMTDLRKAAVEALELLEHLCKQVDPEALGWEDVGKVQALRNALSKPDEGTWQFKIIGFRNVTLPNGKDELQFSIADADAPKGWS